MTGTPAATPAARRDPAELEPVVSLRAWPALLRDALIPFLLSRFVLGIAAWLASGLPPSRKWLPMLPARGWVYTPVLPLDLWARWDTGWFLEIVLRGYDPAPFLARRQSTIAFFPLYPATVRLLHDLLPAAWQGQGAAIAVGAAVSNACAVGALAILSVHARSRAADDRAGARAVASLLAFPTAFLLSCVYTEAMFLLLLVCAWHLAWKRRWRDAGAIGFLLALTRPNGVAMLIPLGWQYLESIDFRLRRVKLEALWLLLIPAGFLAWAAWLYSVTGDPLAAIHAQSSWGRLLASPLALLSDARAYGPVKLLDQALVVGFTLAALAMLRRPEHRGEALLVVTIVLGFAFTGTTLSAARFLLVAFPLHLWIAARLSNDAFRGWLVAGAATQAALFVTWALGGWVG